MNIIKQAILKDLKKQNAILSAREIGQEAIDIDYFNPNKNQDYIPIDSRQWTATLVKWTGKDWKRVRRFNNFPASFDLALKTATKACHLRNLERA